MSLPEVETPAARVLYINSKDATTKYGQFDTDFEFQLEEPIAVPPHNIILLSLYSAEIPYSFYYFDTGNNTRITIQITTYGTTASYTAGGFFDESLNQSKIVFIPEGNYNAIQLANQLSDDLGDTVANPNLFPLTVSWDPITLKFGFVCNTPGIRITIGISNVNPIFPIGAIGGSMNDELGFIRNHPIPINDGDLYVEYDPFGFFWKSGYSNPNPGVAGPGIDTPTAGMPVLGWTVSTPLVAPNVGDLTASVRSLFIRTNLSTNSVLDSHIGGGFSNILARIPINASSGDTIRVEPMNGQVHKLLIKSKTITNISLRLTNQNNVDVDLNGLNFDVSLMLNFIHERDLPEQDDFRQVLDETTEVKSELQEIKINPNPRSDRIPKKEDRDRDEAPKPNKKKSEGFSFDTKKEETKKETKQKLTK